MQSNCQIFVDIENVAMSSSWFLDSWSIFGLHIVCATVTDCVEPNWLMGNSYCLWSEC